MRKAVQTSSQSVSHVYEALKSGILMADENHAAFFASRCHEVFQYATLFTAPEPEVINRWRTSEQGKILSRVQRDVSEEWEFLPV